jgi:hypothetical protein
VKAIVFTAPLLAFAISSAFAQEKGVDMVGLGNVSCDAAAKEMDDSGFVADQFRLSYAQWAWGYWSGMNAVNRNSNEPSRDLSIFQSGQDVASALLTECLKRPSDRVFQSADTIYERMKLK